MTAASSRFGAVTAIIANPLLKRELISILRTRRAFWLLVLVVASSSLLPLLNWPSGGQVSFDVYRLRETFLIFTVTLLLVSALIVPASTAGAFAGERERNTYELLYTTLLPPLAIVVAKLLASTGYILLILVATGPAACVLHLQGGISFDMLVRTFLVILTAVLSSGLICLTCSIRSRRVLHAVLRGVFWVVGWGGGFMLLFLAILFAVHGLLWGQEPSYQRWGFVMAFAAPVAVVSVTENFGRARVPLGFEFWNLYVMYATSVGLGHLVYLLWRVRHPDISAGGPPWLMRWRARFGRRRPRPPGLRRSLFTRLVLELGDRGVSGLQNPVFLKEVRSEFFGRLWFRRAAFWLTLVILGLMAFVPARFVQRTVVVGCTFLGALALVLPGLLATCMSREIDQGNLDALRGSLMPLRRVLGGKCLAGVFGVAGIVAAGVVVHVLLYAVGFVSPGLFRDLDGGGMAGRLVPMILVTLVVFPLTLFFLSSFSLLASVLARSTLAALIGAYSGLAVVLVGWPLLVFLVTNESRWGEQLVAGTNPFVGWVYCFEGFYRRGASRFDNWVEVVAGLVLLYGFLTAVLGAASLALVEKRHARDV